MFNINIFNNNKGIYVNFVNILIVLYVISIYIWSDNEMYIFSNVLCVALIAAIGALLFVEGIKIPYSLVSLVLFDILCMASITWAWEPELSSTMALKTLPLLTVFCVFLFNYIVITKQESFILLTIYVAGIIVAIFTIFLQDGGISAYFTGLLMGMRMGNNINNANTIGLACCASFIIAFYKAYIGKIHQYYYSIPLLVLVILGTGSNKALVMLLIGVTLIVCSNLNRDKIYSSCLKISILLIAFFVCVYFLLSLPVFNTISMRAEGAINAFTGSGIANNSALTRIILTQAGWQQFLETPFLGIGIANPQLIAFASVGNLYYLHNNYMEILVALGLVGFLLYYSSFYMMLKSFYIGIKRNDSMAMIMMIFFIVWLVMQYGYVCYYSKITFVYLALGAAVASKVVNK